MEKLGKFEIIELLGEGATAQVYLARDTQLNREVALKVLKPGLVADPSAFERFLLEAQAAANLFHEHIATVLEMGEVEGRYFIAMRYIPGKSLDKVINEKGSLSWRETLNLVQQIGDALDFAHKKGYIHRDIKPSNIICDEEGNYWLTDFGLVKAMMSTGLSSHTGIVLGTPSYVAPEVWNGEPASPASDQYALACVVYESITGKVLFSGPTPMAVIKKHSEELYILKYWPSDAPEGFERVIHKALEKEPGLRYKNLCKFIEAVDINGDYTGKKYQEEVIEQCKGHLGEDGFLQKWQKYSLQVLGAFIILVLLIIYLLKSDDFDNSLLLAENTINTPIASITETINNVQLFTKTPKHTATFTLIPTPTLDVGSKRVNDIDEAVMMYVPEGEFEMGGIGGWHRDEYPEHTVYLNGYWMYEIEVSNWMYQMCVEDGVCFQPACKFVEDENYDSHPVVCVSWYDADRYCQWAGGRLPTEAEWEKAARGMLEGMVYPWGNEEPNCQAGAKNGAQFHDCIGATTNTGSFSVNGYGLYDMAGNVWEWVADWYSETYYDSTERNNPQGPDIGEVKVLRGGSFYNSEGNLRVANRIYLSPDYQGYYFGFRCAYSP